MNTQLWNDILAFDFDDPISEYGFSTRLANENCWTKNFTAKAILEYKKFTYLAAMADAMVSPCEIVDIVWHQHLIFTQSYSQFCNILGRNIQHIPSTHSKAEAEKFYVARERTSKLYKDAFGEQPTDIWLADSMLNLLPLFPANLSLYTVAVITVFAIFITAAPFYYLLKPVYIHIGNPYFIIGFITLAIAVFIGLEMYNQSYLNKVVKSWPVASFIYDLHPSELIFLQKQNLQNVIHGTINELLKDDRLRITPNNALQVRDLRKSETAEELAITDFLHQKSTAFYPELLQHLISKPLFYNTKNAIDNFKKYFIRSTDFVKLFNINIVTLSLLSMTGIVRVMTGLVRDKPIGQICLAIVILFFVSFVFLIRLINLIGTDTIPRFYKAEILSEKENTYTPDWQYFLFGSSVFTASFTPIVGHVDRNSGDSSSGSSCGSSCGGGCGGGCGGCGGGD